MILSSKKDELSLFSPIRGPFSSFLLSRPNGVVYLIERMINTQKSLKSDQQSRGEMKVSPSKYAPSSREGFIFRGSIGGKTQTRCGKRVALRFLTRFAISLPPPWNVPVDVSNFRKHDYGQYFAFLRRKYYSAAFRYCEGTILNNNQQRSAVIVCLE